MSPFDYYASLARRLSPSELARAAVRRAYRSTRRKLFHAEDPSRREAIAAAFFAETPEQVAERALAARPIAAWCDVRRRTALRAALDRVPAARHRALERARAATTGLMTVFGQRFSWMDASGRIDWMLDPRSGHRYPYQPAEGLPLFVNGSDPKVPWTLGRLESLVALGQGAWAAESSVDAARFAESFVAQLDSFLKHNPPGIGIHWTCTMEVALRAANIAQGLLLMGDAAALRRNTFVLDALEALTAHAQFVEAHLEDGSAVPNNHLVANYVGLLVVGLCFPELPGATRWIAMSVAGLREQMQQQVHEDGWSFEGSVAYHRLSTGLFALANVFAEEAGASLGAAYVTRLRAMFRVCRDIVSEKGFAPQIGDNDSQHAFALADRSGADHGHLAPLGAALLDAAELKPSGSVIPDEGLWLLGLDGLQRYQRLEPRSRARSRISPASGIHVLREAGVLLGVSAGHNGQKGAGGHSHNDKLSFELHLDGVPVIVDPGSPTYGGDPALRNRFRSTAMHNTPQVDGREQNRIDGNRLFALEDLARARVEHFEHHTASDDETPVLQVLECAHDGFGPAVKVRRRFTLSKRALLIEDALEGEGAHACTFRFHLPDTLARVRQATTEERSFAGDGEWMTAVELGPVSAPRAVLLVEGGAPVALEESDYSAGYGERVPAVCATIRVEPRGRPLTQRWFVYGVGRER